MRGRADFDYGNTRLRARRGAFLSVAAYERLLGEDIDDMLRALEDTHYAPPAEAVRRLGGLQALHLTVRSELAGSLEQMRSFYSGRAGLLVDALLSRFDVQNVISVLRARSRPDTSVEEALAALTPVGWLLEPLAREILRPRELAGVVDLLAHWMPDREQAGVLRAAFSEYERTDDLAALERTILADHAARLAGRLRSAGPDGATLLRFRQREIDEHNLLVALRLRDAIASGAEGTPPPADTALAGSTIPPAALAMMVQAVPATIVARIGRLAGGICAGRARTVDNHRRPQRPTAGVRATSPQRRDHAVRHRGSARDRRSARLHDCHTGRGAEPAPARRGGRAGHRSRGRYPQSRNIEG